MEHPACLSPPANSRWCNTNWVRVSRAALTSGTNLQDTLLGLSFLCLEHREGQDIHPQPGGCTAHPHCQHTDTHLHAHVHQSACSHLICTRSLCTRMVCERSMRCPNVCTACACTHICTHACSDVHAPYRACCPVHCCLLHPPAWPGGHWKRAHAVTAAHCEIPQPLSQPWLLPGIASFSGGAVLGPPSSEGLISTLNVFMDNLSPVIPVLTLSFS